MHAHQICSAKPMCRQCGRLSGASAAQLSAAAHFVREAAGQVANHRAVQPKLLGETGRWLHVRQGAALRNPAAASGSTSSHCHTHDNNIMLCSAAAQITSTEQATQLTLCSRGACFAVCNITCRLAHRHQSWHWLLPVCWCTPALQDAAGFTWVLPLQRRLQHVRLWLTFCCGWSAFWLYDGHHSVLPDPPECRGPGRQSRRTRRCQQSRSSLAAI